MIFEHEAEAPERLTWWDKFVRRRRVTRADQIRMLSDLELYHAEQERTGSE